MNPPEHIAADRAAGGFVLRWTDAAPARIPFRTLRGSCPCAVCVDEITGIRVVGVDDVPPDVQPVQVELVGNYALRVRWSDGHDTGLFTWELLRRLSDAATDAKDRTP